MIGQKKSFHVVRNVSIPSTAIAGRTAGTTTDQKMRNGPGAVDVRGLDQLVGHPGSRCTGA